LRLGGLEKDYSMSLLLRIEQLENRLGVGGGGVYWIFRIGDSYELQPNGKDVMEKVVLEKDQFEKWQASRLENDVCFIVSRRD
jgi:hypothetical protein